MLQRRKIKEERTLPRKTSSCLLQKLHALCIWGKVDDRISSLSSYILVPHDTTRARVSSATLSLSLSPDGGGGGAPFAQKYREKKKKLKELSIRVDKTPSPNFLFTSTGGRVDENLNNVRLHSSTCPRLASSSRGATQARQQSGKFYPLSSSRRPRSRTHRTHRSVDQTTHT